jgi:hypothetical protein
MHVHVRYVFSLTPHADCMPFTALQYDGRYDDLLYIFSYQYSLIHRHYATTPGLTPDQSPLPKRPHASDEGRPSKHLVTEADKEVQPA